jgi:hypothetical protein
MGRRIYKVTAHCKQNNPVAPYHLIPATHQKVAGEQLEEELGLLFLDRLDDEVVVERAIEQRAARPGVGQLLQRLRAQRHEKVRRLDPKRLPEIPTRAGHVGNQGEWVGE